MGAEKSEVGTSEADSSSCLALLSFLVVALSSNSAESSDESSSTTAMQVVIDWDNQITKVVMRSEFHLENLAGDLRSILVVSAPNLESDDDDVFYLFFSYSCKASTSSWSSALELISTTSAEP